MAVAESTRLSYLVHKFKMHLLDFWCVKIVCLHSNLKSWVNKPWTGNAELSIINSTNYFASHQILLYDDTVLFFLLLWPHKFLFVFGLGFVFLIFGYCPYFTLKVVFFIYLTMSLTSSSVVVFLFCQCF